MRILIQHPESKRYFNGAQWDAALEDAMNFDTVFSAEQFCRDQDIRSALIVVKFNNLAAQDIKYAVGPANSLLSSKPPTTRLYQASSAR